MPQFLCFQFKMPFSIHPPVAASYPWLTSASHTLFSRPLHEEPDAMVSDCPPFLFFTVPCQRTRSDPVSTSLCL